jgi:hypothetical protein
MRRLIAPYGLNIMGNQVVEKIARCGALVDYVDAGGQEGTEGAR